MINRRTLIKSILSLPFLHRFGNTVDTRLKEAEDQFFDGRWFRVRGNRLEWTQRCGIWLTYPGDEAFDDSYPGDEAFVDFKLFLYWGPVLFEKMIPYEHTMLLVGRKKVWQIIKVDDEVRRKDKIPFWIAYACDREYLDEFIKNNMEWF